MNDVFFMHRCIELAAQGRGLVGNGALVGAVLVREGKIIAEGWHRGFGQVHAERDLLEHFDQELYSTDVLCVNLEPCCHHGKTPPCTDILLERGVQRVVIGMVDPDPRVAGQGIALLKAKGVEVLGPVERARCEWVNRGFVSVRTSGRPWITLKRAQTREGLIANTDGSPLKITSQEQDDWSHTFLRCEHDAILVGVQTIVKDDPVLNTRFDQKKRGYQPWRIIFDPHLRIPAHAKVLRDGWRSKTIVITGAFHTAEVQRRKEEGEEQGVTIFPVPIKEASFAWEELWNILFTPQEDFHGITSILVEGGRKTGELFRSAGMYDEDISLTGSA